MILDEIIVFLLGSLTAYHVYLFVKWIYKGRKNNEA